MEIEWKEITFDVGDSVERPRKIKLPKSMGSLEKTIYVQAIKRRIPTTVAGWVTWAGEDVVLAMVERFDRIRCQDDFGKVVFIEGLSVDQARKRFYDRVPALKQRVAAAPRELTTEELMEQLLKRIVSGELTIDQIKEKAGVPVEEPEEAETTEETTE